MKKINAKQAELAVLLGMAAAVFCAGFCSFADNYNNITDTVFRVHILANSDSDEDQLLKLKVRDAVLEENSCLFEKSKSAEEAAEIAEKNIDRIKRTAERVIAENGKDYSVNCQIAEMHFDNRVYDNITMPAGDYTALRITIGDAKGKNWWCVMFPPLCLPAVTNAEEALEEYGDVLTAEEIDMLSNPENYECKFYILELIDKIKSKLCA